jgi:hypothetical protein
MVAPEIGVEDVLSVTSPLNENVVAIAVGGGVGDEGARKQADSDVHPDARITNRTTQPRLKTGISCSGRIQ